LVLRDVYGNFDFATITGTSVTLGATLTAPNVISYNIDYTGTIYIGQNSATMIDIGCGSIVQAINIGNSVSTLNIGSPTTFVESITGNLTGSCSGSSSSFTGNLAGSVTGSMSNTSIATGVIIDANIYSGAGIQDTKLGTIQTAGKVSNSATTATSANTANAIVARNISGNFSASLITTTGLDAKAISMILTTSTTSAFQLYSGSATNYVSMGVGRSATDLEMAVAGGAGQFSSSVTSTGDCVIRNNNTSNLLIFGIGSALGSLVLSSPSVTPTSSVNGTAFVNGGMKLS
jgi:hypothetical protein